MVKSATAKINRVGPRHTLYLQKDLVEDTTFPFILNEPLRVRVEGERLVVERARGRLPVEADFATEGQVPREIPAIMDDLGFSPLLSKAEKIYEMLKEIHEAETLELRVRNMPPGEHAILLYENKDFLQRIIGEFFESSDSDGGPKGFLSEKPTAFDSVKNLLYDEIVSDEKGGISQKIMRWASELAEGSKASGMGKFAIEDLAWFLKKRLWNDALAWERRVGRSLRTQLTVLCCYNISELDRPRIRGVVSFHDYCVLERPFKVYRKSQS